MVNLAVVCVVALISLGIAEYFGKFERVKTIVYPPRELCDLYDYT